MASFLARALDLPPADEDHFTDDDGAHEDAINRIAEAGITTGCTATRFCPGDRDPAADGRIPVSRPRALTLLGLVLARRQAGGGSSQAPPRPGQPSIRAFRFATFS